MKLNIKRQFFYGMVFVLVPYGLSQTWAPYSAVNSAFLLGLSLIVGLIILTLVRMELNE